MVACFKDKGIFNLVALWVAPEYRKFGIGLRLVDSVVDFARSNKILTVNLIVNKDNNIAIKLYRKMGFIIQESFKEAKISDAATYRMIKYVKNSY